ncbi:MAG: T9SS type A sorting domain-containing protein [Ignavibacteriaceae bacterium]|nr:T9SS type A sorting domain-containing protein [Ignavibacteriaceae bacterium]
MKKLFLILLFNCLVFSQTQHNIWYGFGPYGGTVTEISINSYGNIAAITNGGLSYYYYEWIHMYNSQEFTHTSFLGTSDTLIASDLDSLYWTADVSYHWKGITPLEKPIEGIRIKKIPQITFYLWADSTIYSGGWIGSSWNTIDPGKGIINDLYINKIDDQSIIIATERGVFRSSDNGVSWITLPVPEKNYKALAGDNIPPFKLVTFADDSNLVYLSSNNGDTWISTYNGLSQGKFELTDAIINTSGQIFVSAESGVYRTTNFGTNWGPFSDGLEYPDFGIPKTLGVHTLQNDGNYIYAGTDEGLFEKNPAWPQWSQIGPNNQKCLSLGKSTAFLDMVLLGTPNGVKVYSGYGDWIPADNYGVDGFPINALVLSNSWDGIALAGGIFPEQNGFIQMSGDAGFTWQTIYNFPLGSGKFNYFLQRKDSSQIYLALNEGINSNGLLIANVVSDPYNWQLIPGTNGLNFIFPAVFQNNSNQIYFLVNDSLLYKSEDGGRSVQYVSYIPGGRYNSIYAVEHYNGDKNIYACGQGVKISSDFGITWENYGLDDYEVVRMIYESWSLLAATRNDGFFAKYHSTGDWTPFSIGLDKGLIINDALNWTTWILHTATANHSVFFLWLIINDVEDENGQSRLNDFVLSQNFPNPFNPSTRIKYQIQDFGFVSLKIYDVLGNEIATLVNEEKLPGTYEVAFDATNISSGVYYYQIRHRGFTETKKMVILK